MNADTCKDFIKALELHHDRKFSKMEQDAYWGEVRDISDERVLLALQASYGKFPPGRVPSINDIKALLGKIRETAQAKEKGAEMASRYPLLRRPRSNRPMVNESFEILNGLFNPIWPRQQGDHERLTSRQCVAEMLKMEEKYPGTGWRRGAEQLRAWLDRKEERERNAVDKELKEIESLALAELEKEKVKGAE